MSVMLCEQETSINFSRDSDFADIYTSDSTVMTKLDKLVESEDAPDWHLVKEIYDQNKELVAKMYRTKKKLISYRSVIIQRELTDEQKEASRERMAAMRQKAKEKREMLASAEDSEDTEL